MSIGRQRTRLLALMLGLVAVGAAALPGIIEAAGPKAHDPGATPAVDGGTTTAIVITIKNTSTSGNITAQALRVAIPAGLPVANIVSVTKPANAAGTITAYALPGGTLAASHPYVEILDVNIRRNDTYSFSINARIPCGSAGASYAWVTDVRQSNDFNGTNNQIPAVDPDPTPAVTTVASGCSLAFTAQPKSALPGAVITNSAFDPSAATKVKVAVRSGGASPVTVTWFSGNVLVATTPSTTLGGTSTRPLLSGEATFNDLTIAVPDTYRLVASASGAASATSDPFAIGFGVTVTCDIDQAICTTGDVPGPTSGTTGNIVVNDNDSLKATLTAKFITNDIDCAGYTEFGDRLFFDVDVIQGSLAGLTKTVTVTKPIPAGMPSGAGEEWRYQVCFQSRDQFAAITYSSDAQTNFNTLLKALSGDTVTSPAEEVPNSSRVIGDLSQPEYRGLLPQCSLVNNVAPCLVGLPIFANGKVTWVGRVPAADPVWK